MSKTPKHKILKLLNKDRDKYFKLDSLYGNSNKNRIIVEARRLEKQGFISEGKDSSYRLESSGIEYFKSKTRWIVTLIVSGFILIVGVISLLVQLRLIQVCN